MNEIFSSLKDLISTIPKTDINVNESYELLKTECDKCRYACMVEDVDKNLCYYINIPASDYFGLNINTINKYGLSVSQEILHPNFFHLYPIALDFFSQPENYNNVYEYIYYYKTAKGYTWTYVCSQIAIFHENGNPAYILSVASDLNDILNNKISTNRFVSEIEGFKDIDYEKYKSLTKREVQILGMISKEMTSEEIAKELFLSKSTIDSHRKTLLKKLNIKSALGMAKYYYLFGDDNQ